MKSGYYLRDAYSFVSSLPAGAVDITITSPPYGAMKDYGAKDQIGHGQTFEEYLDSACKVFETIFEKTKKTGSLWIVADTFKQRSQMRLLPFELASRLAGVGWNLQDVIIWNKTKTLPWSRQGQLRRTFEYILFFSKSRDFKYFVSRIKEPDNLKEWWVKYPERYSPEGKVPTTIWNFAIPVQGSWSKVRFRHFCPFPTKLVERILLLASEPGDLVLDPFAGSGIVLAQAKAMGRGFIGCDVNKNYRDQFYRTISQHIGEKWTKNKKVLRDADATRRHLAQTIRKLRQVKFPKALFKEVRKAMGASRVSGVKTILAKCVSMNGRSSPDCFSQVFVYFLCDEGAPISEIEREARTLSLRPPLSKYGIRAEVHAECLDKFSKSRDGRLLAGQKLYLYREGVTNDAQEEIKSPEWFSVPVLLWKRIPPIVTNIEVHQAVVPTWAPTKAEY